MKQVQVSIIVPIKGEEETALVAVESLRSVQQMISGCEVLFVGHSSRLEFLTAKHKGRMPYAGFHYLRGHFRSAGEAIAYAMEKAKGNILCTTDADMTYPNETIPDLVRIVRRDRQKNVHTYIASGDRMALETNAMTPFHRFVKRLMAALYNLRHKTAINDVNCMLRAYDRKFIKAITIPADNTLWFATYKHAAKHIVEVPITYKQRVAGRSTIAPIRLFFQFLWSLI